MDLSNLTIGQLAELSSVLCNNKNATPHSQIEGRGKHIVVLQRGWVVVGDLFKQGHDCMLKNCWVIRNWGTTKGLGEIAENGATSKTVLDPSPEISFNELTVVLFIKCNESKWK